MPEFTDRSRHLKTIAALMFLLLLLSGYFLADTVRRQFDEQYRERLHSSLSTYGVILNYTYEGMTAVLQSLVRDERLITALDDGAPDSLRRMLMRAAAKGGVDVLHLLDQNGRVVASAATGPSGYPDVIDCFAAAGHLVARSEGVYLTRMEAVMEGAVRRGLVCGAVLITPAGGVAGLKEILRASPFMVVGGHDYHLDPALSAVALAPVVADGALHRWRSPEGDFLGMAARMAIGPDELTIGLLLADEDFLGRFGRPLAAVGFSLVAMLLLAWFALRSMWQQRQTERRLDRLNEQALVTLASIGDSVVTTDVAGRVAFANRAVQRLLGVEPGVIENRPWQALLPLREESSGAPLDDPVARCVATRRPVFSGGIVMLRLGRRDVPVKYTVAPILVAGEVTGTVIVLHDVSNEHAMHRKLAWKAEHDDLTGLPNRRSFYSAVADELASLRQGGRTSALLFLDLDRFKTVNDSCGHDAGDRLLQAVCGLFLERLRGDDMLARLGGDEFGVLLRGATPAQAQVIAERLVRSLEQYRFEHRGAVFRIGVSIGLLPLDGGATTLEEVLKKADAACYQAKASGRGRVSLFDVA